MNGTKIGMIEESKKPVYLSDDVNNMHILCVGQSGAGKSFASMQLVKNFVENGASVCVINMNQAIDLTQIYDQAHIICVKKEGLPLSLFSRRKGLSGQEASAEDLVDEILDVFCTVKPLHVRQRSALRDAIRRAMHRDDRTENEVGVIGRELLRACDNVADSVYAHFEQMFRSVRVHTERCFECIVPGKIMVFDLSGYGIYTQRFLTEWILSALWGEIHTVGKCLPFPQIFLCDEFQELSLKPDAILSQILREGRKFNVAMILATQTLENFSKAERAILQQAATQLYFRPAASEVNKILGYMGRKSDDGLKKRLLKLQRGECIAVGCFDVGNFRLERPIKISFRSDKYKQSERREYFG